MVMEGFAEYMAEGGHPGAALLLKGNYLSAIGCAVRGACSVGIGHVFRNRVHTVPLCRHAGGIDIES